MGVTSKYFSDPELACSCCGVNKMDQAFVDKLTLIRDLMAVPLQLSSAYRCPKHNAAVSSTGADGPHTTGHAVDVRVYGKAALDLIDIARAVGMTGIGVSQRTARESRFIHLDDLPPATNRPRPWLWSY